jgi:hypothetical protein
MDGGGVKGVKFTCFVTHKSFVNDLIKLGIDDNLKKIFKN